MRLERTEGLGEGDVLGLVNWLVSEEQHLEVGERSSELGHDRWREWRTQVESLDESSNGCRLELHGEAVVGEAFEAFVLGLEVSDGAHL